MVNCNIALLGVFTTFITSSRAIGENLNILLIIVDDLRPLTDQNLILPNIQKLAGNGVNFNLTYAQQALCAPSRNSMLTGRRPDALRLYDFYSYWRTTVGNFTTLPQLFKENGYDTYSVGKVFHPAESSNYTDDFPYSWSYKPYHPPTDKYKDAPVCQEHRKHKRPPKNEFYKNLLCPVVVKVQPGKSLPDIQTVEYAAKILRQRKHSSKPFFLAVGFHKPHIPLKFPRRYLAKVPINSVSLPNQTHFPSNTPPVAWQPWYDLKKRHDIYDLDITFPYGITPANWTLKIRQHYYAAALYIDDLIGKLVSHVNGNDTLVVLTSDHGWSLGENGLWAKYSNFDVALRVPLIFSGPQLPRRVINTPVELLDVFPTLADLAGLNVPKCVKGQNSTTCFEGESLFPLMWDIADKKSFAISQYPRPSTFPAVNSDKPRLKEITIMGYSIRTIRYRYTEWIHFNNKRFIHDWKRNYGIELYDHKFDSYEANNLYNNPIYKDVKGQLSQLLRSQVDQQ